MNNVITVFTPTYNRANMISNLYNSLLQQTCKNFCWLIVDDGSTDNTEEVIKQFKEENKLDIIYIKKQNGGKHTALNVGIETCETHLFTCVDSDDTLTNDAVEIIVNYWKIETENIIGFVGKRGKFNENNEKNRRWPSNVKYLFFNDLYQKYGFEGETIIIFKTEIIKRYKFPEFVGENFVTEAVLYDQLNYIGHMRVINEIIYLFEYLPDGYTYQGIKLMFKNPKGHAYKLKQGSILNKYKFKKIMGMAKYYAWVKFNRLDSKQFACIKSPFWLSCIGKILSLPCLLIYNLKYYNLKKQLK